MKFTKEQQERALKRLTKTYGEWNVITKNDRETRGERTNKMHKAAWQVIIKFGLKNEYFKATRDVRAKW